MQQNSIKYHSVQKQTFFIEINRNLKKMNQLPKSSELVLEALKQMQVLSNEAASSKSASNSALVTQSSTPLLNNNVVVPEEQEGAQEQLRALIDGRPRTQEASPPPTAEANGKKLLNTVCLRSSLEQVDHVSVLDPVSVDSEDSEDDQASITQEATSTVIDVDEILLQQTCKN